MLSDVHLDERRECCAEQSSERDRITVLGPLRHEIGSE